MIGKQRAAHTDSLWELFNLGTPESTEWMREGLCAQTDPDAFHPDRSGSVEAAKAVCASCPVMAKCRSYALEQGERFGMWGGLSANERRAIRRQGAERRGRVMTVPIPEGLVAARCEHNPTDTPEFSGHQAA